MEAVSPSGFTDKTFMIFDCSNCKTTRIKRGLCNRHYLQWTRHGKIFKRTIFDKNEIKIKNDRAEIILCDNLGNKIGKVLIDLEDVEKVKSAKWHINTGYAARNIKKSNGKRGIEFLHHFLIPCEKSLEIDHIDRNRLNNQKANLRTCTRSQNKMNTQKYKNNTSGIKGVCWDKRAQKWNAQIQKEKKHFYLGYFDLKEDARNAYIEASKELHGIYAFCDALERDMLGVSRDEALRIIAEDDFPAAANALRMEF